MQAAQIIDSKITTLFCGMSVNLFSIQTPSFCAYQEKYVSHFMKSYQTAPKCVPRSIATYFINEIDKTHHPDAINSNDHPKIWFHYLW